jgi:hypothetical protein
VVLLDISGSMEPYARALLRFMHAAVAGRQRVEAFAFSTRLTRLTKELRSRDPDKAIQRAAEQVPDWSGGTRLGESLRKFNDTWGVRGLARGAIVIVLSDGWDRGNPGLLGEQMKRLQRVSHRLIWVNPLKVTPGYAPLAKGMAAALPYIDEFVEGHSLEAMEACVGNPWIDVVHVRVNPYGEAMDKNDPALVVPVIEKLHKEGKGIVGMKLIGNGKFSNDSGKIDASLQYVLGLGTVDMIIVGFELPEQIDNYTGRINSALKKGK